MILKINYIEKVMNMHKDINKDVPMDICKSTLFDELRYISKIFLFIGIFLILIVLSSQIRAQNANIEVILPSTYQEVAAGSEIWFTVNILNLDTIERKDIVLVSQLVDAQNSVLLEKSKTVAIETQASFVNNMRIPEDSRNGKHYILVKAVYSNESVLEARQEFLIVKKPPYLWYLLFFAIGIFLLFGIFFLVFFYKSAIARWKLHARIKEIVNKRFKK